MVERQAENLEAVRSIRTVSILLFNNFTLIDQTIKSHKKNKPITSLTFGKINSTHLIKMGFKNSKTLNTKNLFLRKSSRRKFQFLVLNAPVNKITIIQNKYKSNIKFRKHYKFLKQFFKQMPSNNLFYKKSNKFLAYLLLYFFTTHDLHFFTNQLTKFLQNTPKRFQLKLIRCFALLNTNKYKSIFKAFDLQGVYFRVSGKFGGIGGSKKLRRTLV